MQSPWRKEAHGSCRTFSQKWVVSRGLAERDRNIDDGRDGDCHRQPENTLRQMFHAPVDGRLLPVAKFFNEVATSNRQSQ